MNKKLIKDVTIRKIPKQNSTYPQNLWIENFYYDVG